jgi:flagellar protein FliO/FliZ
MDLIDVARYFAALLLVLALVGGAGLAVRRFGMPGVMRGQGARRLAVVETLMLGPKQRLYILRRDNVEHLVMSGPEGTTVVEAGIPPAPLTSEIAV